jgi:hypothetical protein
VGAIKDVNNTIFAEDDDDDDTNLFGQWDSILSAVNEIWDKITFTIDRLLDDDNK